MKYKYQTNAGTNGHIMADNRQEALVKLEGQYGTGKIALIDGKAPTLIQNAGDPHGWSAAFQAAASD